MARPFTSTVRWLSLNDFRPLRTQSPSARSPTARMAPVIMAVVDFISYSVLG